MKKKIIDESVILILSGRFFLLKVKVIERSMFFIKSKSDKKIGVFDKHIYNINELGTVDRFIAAFPKCCSRLIRTARR